MTQRELFDLTNVVMENNENRDAIAEKFGETIADNAVQVATNCAEAIEFPTLTPDLDQAGELIYRPVDVVETVKSVKETFEDFSDDSPAEVGEHISEVTEVAEEATEGMNPIAKVVVGGALATVVAVAGKYVWDNHVKVDPEVKAAKEALKEAKKAAKAKKKEEKAAKKAAKKLGKLPQNNEEIEE